MKFNIKLAIFLIYACLFSCSTVDLDKEIQTLSILQKQEQVAHLTNDALLLDGIFNDTVCQVKNGEISYFAKEQMEERFSNYFNNVAFLKWEDLNDPIYTLSEDGTLAHILINKRVELTEKLDTTGFVHKTDFAWSELWKKKAGEWKLYTITSTDKKAD
jgi:hypothetical protein